jgi:hypothetical protein
MDVRHQSSGYDKSGILWNHYKNIFFTGRVGVGVFRLSAVPSNGTGDENKAKTSLRRVKLGSALSVQYQYSRVSRYI